MPSIVSDFSPFGWVGFNLSYCYEIPIIISACATAILGL
jgi:hypothetical protein